MIVGLTGQIGSGKSCAALVLKRLGATVIDADQIGRQVVDESVTLRKQLVRAFGRDILTPSGRLRRKRLAELAFATPESHLLLNRLVHPHLLKELRRQVRIANKTAAPVVIDAALLLDWGMDREVDRVLVIHAGRDKRHARMQARGFSRADTRARESRQPSYADFCAIADRVIMNSGAPADLERKVHAYYRSLSR